MTQIGYGRAAIVCTFIICVSQIVCVYIYAHHTRFDITQSGERAFKIDRMSGDMWMIINGKYAPVEGPANFSH